MSAEPEIFTKYPSLRKVQGVPDEEIVESHDGRETTLLRFIYNHPDLDTNLRGSPGAILEVMDDFAAKEDFLIDVGEQKAGLLRDLIREQEPKVMVELGGYLGCVRLFVFATSTFFLTSEFLYRYSAILFGSLLQEFHQTHPAEDLPRLYSLEIEPLFASIAMNLVNLAGLSPFVEIVVGSSQDSLRRLQKDGTLKNIDLLFIDHVEDLYKPDLELCEKLGLLEKPGSLVLADNVLRPGAPAYREYVRSNPRFAKSWALPGLIVPGDIEVSASYLLMSCLTLFAG